MGKVLSVCQPVQQLNKPPGFINPTFKDTDVNKSYVDQNNNTIATVNAQNVVKNITIYTETEQWLSMLGLTSATIALSIDGVVVPLSRDTFAVCGVPAPRS